MAQPYKTRRVRKRELPKIPVSFILFKNLGTYLLSPYLNKQFVNKLSIFFETVDTSEYSEDNDSSIYFLFVQRFSEIVVTQGITDCSLICDKLLTSPDIGKELGTVVDELLHDVVLFTQESAVYVENEFIGRLNAIGLYPKIETMSNLIADFTTQNYTDYVSITKSLQIASREVFQSITAYTNARLTIPDLVFDKSAETNNALTHIVKQLNTTNRLIHTGVKRLDRMLGGGYEPGRVYMGLAVSGGWKSGWLLNSWLWAARYNQNVVMRDPLRRPCALYINLENDTIETTDRIVSYLGARDKHGNVIPAEQFQELYESTLGDRWLLGLLYREKGSITTGDLDGIINDFESANECEVKLLIVDYIKRIAPAKPYGDIRLDMGEVVNDLSILAKARQIPVLTANQLNRAAYEVLDMEKENKNGKKIENIDAGKRVNQAHTSESSLANENADVLLALNKEFNKLTGLTYLTVKKIKDRGAKDTDKFGNPVPTYFAHPFENGMKLREDSSLPQGEFFSYDSIQDSIDEIIGQESDVIEEDRTKVAAVEKEFLDL